MPDFERMAAEVVGAARGFVERAMAGLSKRVDDVEAMVLSLQTPKDSNAPIVTGEGPPLAAGEEGQIYLDAKSGNLYKWS